MALELQIRESALAQALIEWVQIRLFTLCVPTNAPMMVDHLDALPGSVNFSNGEKDGVDAKLAVAIYAVNEADLLAHPNTIPDGAMKPAGQLALLIQLGVQNRALTIIDASSRPSASGLSATVLSEIKHRVDDLLSTLRGMVLFDCAPIVSALGAYVPAEPDLGRGGGVVTLRFGSSGATISQLGPNQSWGIFVDANEAADLLKRKLSNALPVPVNVGWQANGPTPSIVADTSIDVSVAGIDAVARVDITAVPSFIAPSTLRLSVSWDFELAGAVWFAEAAARRVIRGQIRRMLPDANHNGAQTFYFDIALPSIPAVLDAQPRWAEITSSPAGMTIGGPIFPGPIGSRETLEIFVVGFGRPVWWGHCRALAKGGDGSPPEHFEAASPSVRAEAGVNFTAAGSLCGAQVLPPYEWLSGQWSAGVEGIGFDLTVGTARRITSDVHVIVRTARGARFIALGKPIIQRKEGGEGLDVQVNYIDDCLDLSGPWLKLALGQTLTVDDVKPPPFEDPDWREWLHAERGLNSHLVTVGQLDTGEIITVRGRGLQIQVTANDDGEALIPGLVAIADDMYEVVVERTSMRPFDGPIHVQTVEFTWLGEVGPADAAAVRDIDGIAYVGRVIADTMICETYRPDDERTFHLVRNEEVALNPQPLPPEPPDAARLAEVAGVHDLRSAQFLPGLGGSDTIALVTLRDGRTVIVSADSSKPRVSGEYAGPLLGMHVDGDFAIAKNGDCVHLFTVSRPKDFDLEPGNALV